MDILTAHKNCTLHSAVNGASNSCSCLRLCARKPVFFCGSLCHPLIRTCSENGNAVSLRMISFLRAIAKGGIVICFNLFREWDWEKYILNFKKKKKNNKHIILIFRQFIWDSVCAEKLWVLLMLFCFSGLCQDFWICWPQGTQPRGHQRCHNKCPLASQVSQLPLEPTDLLGSS